MDIELLTTCEQCGQPIPNVWYLRLIQLCRYCDSHLFPRRSREEVVSDDTVVWLVGAGPFTPIREDWTFQWNYEASDILREAVNDGVLTQTEAEIVMDYAVYEQPFVLIAQELELSFSAVVTHYETALGKLREYLTK